ncbi:ankyrin repeat and death domain-containing protein 1A-like isoform X2 [Ischnura elegans]|uniref:ankyrin repeat and death domain-containing protein 1A-like isoform X2 n=1 Tax=Ischnura elegans TaxID=197161 RepID=UPI001ED8A5E2|nr:ankyrin repeat and death domain-containing protein 1A-like isoform X2 [Ischnura elegans]
MAEEVSPDAGSSTSPLRVPKGPRKLSTESTLTFTDPLEGRRSPRVLKNDLLLHEAVIKNDPEAVQRILKEPHDANSRNNYGRAPIHWASSRGNTEIMEMLIAAKCDIEAKDKFGMRPLLMAAWHGHADAVRLLINCGASVNAVNKKQHTILHCAAHNNRLEVVNFLLDTLDEPNLEAVDAEKQTPLHHAALGGHSGVVRRILEAGASTSATDKRGRTPLHAACERGHVETVELLLLHRRPESKGDEGAACPDVDTRDARDVDGNTPLHAAVENQQTQAALLLLEHGAPADAENVKGYTPLHVASSLGCRGIIEGLVQHGCTVNKQSKNGNTPLHVACLTNETETIELLIAKGADVNALNVRLQSPIHLAAEQGFSDICKILLNAGANIDQREQDSHFHGRSNLEGAKPMLPKYGGKTPLYIAARGSFTAIVDMIIKTARLDYPIDKDGCGSSEDKELGHQNSNATRRRRRGPWRRLSSGVAEGAVVSPPRCQERLRELLWKVSYKQLGPGEWRRLALHWKFTEDQIRAIEHQYTGPSSYKEHGFRMLLIWAHGLPPDANPVKELYESLTAIDKKGIADALRRKLDEENAERYKNDKRKCNACSIT